jgi:peptidoglycan/xylan/chitin deacetylase (PgdA/CDA1 family)
MTDVNNDRRARVQRLKRILLGTFLTLLILPTVLCIIAFVQIHSLNRQVNALTAELQQLTSGRVLSEEALGGQPAQNADVSRSDAQPGQRTEADAGSEAGNPAEESPEGTGTEAAESTPEEPDNLRRVYLTFDDGPSIYTDQILDILAEADVKATFFVVGRTDETSLAAYKRIVEEGHTLGMHSYSHKYNEIYASEEAFAEDFEKLRSYLEEVTGVSPQFYRFPGGSSNTVSRTDMGVFAKYLREQGVTYFDWNISSGDASGGTLSASTIHRNALSGVADKKTAVILFHDAGDKYSTVRALPDVIKDLQAMENTVILPITEDTVPIQHVTFEE